MSGPDDRWFERYSEGEFDADVDMLLDGVVVDPRLVPLARLVDDARVVAGGPPPAPTLELAAALTGHNAAEEDLSPGAASAARIGRRYVPPSRRGPSDRRPPARLPSRIGAMSLAAKAALSLAVAGAGAVAAGASGVLPESAVNAVRHAIEAVTPLDLPDAGASGHADQGHHAAPTGGTADREPVDLAAAGEDAVAIEHRPPLDADLADDPQAATPRTSDDRSVAATSTDAPSTQSGLANGNAGGPPPHPPGNGEPPGTPPPGDDRGHASRDGAGSPGPEGIPTPGHGQHPDAAPPPDSGPPAGVGPPADAGPPAAVGPPGGGPAGGASAPAHGGAAPAAPPAATGPPPAPGL